MNPKLRVLEPVPCASHADVERILLDALDCIRREKTLSIALAIETEKETYTTYCITVLGTWAGLLGVIEIVKLKIRRQYAKENLKS